MCSALNSMFSGVYSTSFSPKNVFWSSLPTIMDMISSSEWISAISFVPTVFPSFRTVTRSPISFNSFILWEMYTIPIPVLRSSRIILKRFFVSSSVKDEVGSSITSNFEFSTKAFAISTSCFSEMDSWPTLVVTGFVSPTRFAISSACFRYALLSTTGRTENHFFTGSLPTKRFSAIDKSFTTLSSW